MVMKRGVPYLPKGLKTFPKMPTDYDFGVEIHVPGKEVQTQYFSTEKAARDYLAKVRELQTKVVLYVRLIRQDKGLYVNGTGRLRIVPPVKGKMYCNICNDYTEFHNKYGWEDSDAKHCQYCSISDNDWYIKSLNGLWEGMRVATTKGK